MDVMNFKLRRLWTKSLLPVLLSVTVCLFAGCAPKGDYKFTASDTTSYAAPQLEPALTASDQAEGTRLVREYIADIDKKDYGAARKLFAPTLQAKWPSSVLAHQLTTQGFWTMLPGSHDWGFNQFQSIRHGNEMVVHTQFVAVDTNLYKTNFTFRKSGNGWLIDAINYPVQKNRAPLVLGGLSGAPSAPGHK